MPMFTLNHVYRFSVKWRWDGVSDIVNVWHALCTASSTTNDLEAVEDATEALVELYGSVTGAMSILNVHSDVGVYDETASALMIPLGVMPDLNGQNSAESTAPQNAALIWARTSVPRMLGKKYLPPFTELSWAKGVLVEAAQDIVDAMAVRWGEFVTTTNGTGFRFGVWGPAHGFHAPLVATASTLTAIQRRRRQGRGS